MNAAAVADGVDPRPRAAAGPAPAVLTPHGGPARLVVPRLARPAVRPGEGGLPARHCVRLLGGFRLTVDGRPVRVPASTQRLIALLALRGRYGRSRLAGTLWPEVTEARALASLRTAIWRANQVAPGLVDPAHDSIGLAGDADIDVTRLVRIAHDVMDGRVGIGADTTVVRYVEGDLLPDWADDWLVVDRERLRQLRLHVLEILASQLAVQGLFGLALEAALAALRADVLRESAHRAVIRIHLAEGNRAEALHAYRECCSVLAREVGVPPSAETVRLIRPPVHPPGTPTQASSA